MIADHRVITNQRWPTCPVKMGYVFVATLGGNKEDAIHVWCFEWSRMKYVASLDFGSGSDPQPLPNVELLPDEYSPNLPRARTNGVQTSTSNK